MEKINKYYLNINDRAFESIKIGTKKVEIRVTTDKSKKNYGNILKNDIIYFKNSKNEMLKCIVDEINWYKNEKELFKMEGTKYTLSSTNDVDEGIKSINSYPSYTSGIKENGIYAIHIRPLINNIYDMKLQKESFDYIKNGTKRLEIRLNDEKRKQLKLGDIINFHLISNKDKIIKVKIIGLLFYDNIKQLINDYDISILTCKNMSQEQLISSFNNIYPKHQQQKYGILAIKFKLLTNID